MEKLYIATTTLNFNNILSTESISPKSFYKNRNFGYKRFETIEPNRFENSLIAYDKIPYFKINDNELDNYLLIVEISKDIIKDLNKIDKVNDIEVFQISQTIYFHPNKVKFLFLNEEHKKTTFIKAEPSIETKLLPLYQTKAEIINKKDTFKWEKKYLEKIIEQNIDIKQHAYNDILINKIKGFYICYTLGEIYSNLTIQGSINTVLDDNRYKRQQAQNNTDYQAIYTINEEENKYLEKVIKSLNIDIYKTVNLNNNKLISFANHNDISELYKNIINDVVYFDKINSKEDFKIDRLELLKKIGDNFKEANFEGQDKSIEYIRGLMKNIKNYEPFEAEGIHIKNYDILLKSISYFILRGNDLEKLLNILKENDMKTFKMAFGLWGALFGFSAIPKTISNILFKEKNKNFIDIQDFLQDMYKKIHSMDNNQEIKILYIQIKQVQKSIENIQTKPESTIKNTLPKCPDCGGEMVKRASKKDGKYKNQEFLGCKNYPKCKGPIWDESDKSMMSKAIDCVKKPFTHDNSLDNIIYDFIKEQSGKAKITDARKVIKINKNEEFKAKYSTNNRFELYKEKNIDMIKIMGA